MRQGEELILRLDGCRDYDLREVEFDVFVYPCCSPTAEFKKTKDDCEPSEDEADVFYCVYTAEETAKFPAGVYALEIRDVTNGRIYVTQRRFVVEESATAIDINSRRN